MLKTMLTTTLRTTVVLTAFAACSRGAQPGATSGAEGDRSAPTAASSSPDSQIARYLSLSIATRAPHQGMFDSVSLRTADEGDWDHGYWLADYQVFAVRLQGDSAFATVRITTVVDEQVDAASPRDASRNIGTIRIQEDSALWTLARQPAGQWVVAGQGRWLDPRINPTNQFVDLDVVPIHTWRPSGASKERAIAVVDSIRQSRGHPPLR